MPASTVLESQAADTVLVRKAMDGDRAAFGELYERHKRMVHGILMAHVPYSEVEDLMQSVFMQAMESLPRLRDAEAFGGWLAAIARNLAFDHHRRRKDLVEINEFNGGSTHGKESEMALDAIRRLPEAYRETLMLRFVEGMTGPEIAARTNLTPDSVRVNLCRGIKLLRAELGGRTEHGR
ncbi:MAG: sigma-70 family RNA polymerase sigma factor [Acidobacteriota bacterium]|nr:sigma-70 family RNA polymerase sigma factor [Acidobacteriota bacterium]